MYIVLPFSEMWGGRSFLFFIFYFLFQWNNCPPFSKLLGREVLFIFYFSKSSGNNKYLMFYTVDEKKCSQNIHLTYIWVQFTPVVTICLKTCTIFLDFTSSFQRYQTWPYCYFIQAVLLFIFYFKTLNKKFEAGGI